MILYIRQVISTYRRAGLEGTIQAIAPFLRGVVAGVVFGIVDRLYSTDRRTVCLTVRGNTPDSDTFALIDQVADAEEVTRLCIGYRSDLRTEHIDRMIGRTDDTSVVVLKMHTVAFVRHMLETRIVLQKNDLHLRWYRLLGSRDREFVRLYHGPITKAYGRTRTSSVPIENGLASVDLRIDTPAITRSVGSDVELHFRAVSEDRHPATFETYGYPRFDRIADFESADAEPIVHEETESTLESNEEHTCILYATTHKDGVYETTFFPFPSFDPAALRDHLRENDIRLFLRPHPGENGGHQQFVDGEVIFSAGQSFSASATEILPFFDAVVTDYSSIYVEFLPFDRPILFLKDDHERFCEIRGFAFDYERYFPGPKVEEFDRFLDHLTEIAESGGDGYASRRQFVEDTFVPAREEPFIRTVLAGNGHT